MDELKAERDELKADLALKQLGVTPRVYHFFKNVSPFFAVTIAEDALVRSSIEHKLDRLFNECSFDFIFGPATLLRRKLREDGIYGVAICDWRDTFNYQRGRIIAKGRLATHLKQQRARAEAHIPVVYKTHIDDAPRTLTEEQRAQGKEWYRRHKSYFEV